MNLKTIIKYILYIDKKYILVCLSEVLFNGLKRRTLKSSFFVRVNNIFNFYELFSTYNFFSNKLYKFFFLINKLLGFYF